MAIKFGPWVGGQDDSRLDIKVSQDNALFFHIGPTTTAMMTMTIMTKTDTEPSLSPCLLLVIIIVIAMVSTRRRFGTCHGPLNPCHGNGSIVFDLWPGDVTVTIRIFFV